MNNLPNWLYPSAPKLRGQCRDVLLFGSLANEDDDGYSLKGKPLKRSRPGSLPTLGTETRRCYDAVPIAPESITSIQAGRRAGVTAGRACNVLVQLADRKVPLVRRVYDRDGMRWTRDR